MKRVYVAGPMSGYPDHNYAAFIETSKTLRENGFNVITPVDIANDICRKQSMTREEIPVGQYARYDIEAVFWCDVIFMLKGWERSIGARAEHAIAVWLRKEITYEVVEIY